MAYYAVGDIQGCYDPLARLLECVKFDPAKDTLICVGDLVNRGPKSLKVLKLLKSIDNQCVSVLGNHDIHLLAMLYGIRKPRSNDTLQHVIDSPLALELADWLRNRPLLVVNEKRKFAVCHAGIYPWWSKQQALENAGKVEALFRDENNCIKLLKKIYSNRPSRWSDSLGKTQQARFTINAFTRMRFCSPKGHLNLVESGFDGKQRKNRVPWFEIENKSFIDYRIIFGHWSSLGLLNSRNHLCLDTGYVWGREMTMAKIPRSLDKKVKLISTPFRK